MLSPSASTLSLFCFLSTGLAIRGGAKVAISSTVDPSSPAQVCGDPVPGCTFVESPNYDPLATVNDGSCAMPSTQQGEQSQSICVGCHCLRIIDHATRRTVFIYFCPAGGCIYAFATNYDADADFDDGSCIFPSFGGGAGFLATQGELNACNNVLTNATDSLDECQSLLDQKERCGGLYQEAFVSCVNEFA